MFTGQQYKKQRVSKLHPPTGGRNLIGRRTQSDRTADAIRSGGGRNLIGRRSVYDDKTQQTEQKKEGVSKPQYCDKKLTVVLTRPLYYKISLNGTITKSRSCMCGCGSVRSGVESCRSSYIRMSMSMGRS